MQLEVGEIYEGKVTGITKFGVFVSFKGGQTGMVHISEVATTFVNEIRDFVSDGQTVKVKVLSVSEEGKVSLSMKKALDPESQPEEPQQRKPRESNGDNRKKQGFGGERRYNNRSKQPEPGPARPGDFEWQPRSTDSLTFEDMLTRFKQTSDEKISDIKRGTETKRGYSRRGK